MNLQHFILYSTFSVIYCRKQMFSIATTTVSCDTYKSLCDSKCYNGVCDISFCYDIRANSLTSEVISKCSHFRCSDNCESNCEYLPGGVCICKTGYIINIGDQRECIPHCSQKCENGWCSAPEACSCNNGYELSSNKYKCLPKCFPPCTNGHCTAEGTCMCNHSYRLRSNKCVPIDNGVPNSCPENYTFQNNKCKPVCEPMCGDNMKCVVPNVCRCLKNYKFNNRTSHCELKCTECIDGRLEDNVCVCNEIDKTDRNNKCKCISKCSPPCDNGHCSIDGVCICKSNYSWNKTFKCKINYNNNSKEACIDEDYAWNIETSKCELKCVDKCINGRCIQGICKCKEAYKRHPNNIHRCISKCSPPCIDGYCSASGICICPKNYYLNPNKQNECITNPLIYEP